MNSMERATPTLDEVAIDIEEVQAEVQLGDLTQCHEYRALCDASAELCETPSDDRERRTCLRLARRCERDLTRQCEVLDAGSDTPSDAGAMDTGTIDATEIDSGVDTGAVGGAPSTA